MTGPVDTTHRAPAPPAGPDGPAFVRRLAAPRTPPDERATLLANPVFGTVFTEHMVTIRHTTSKGWHDAVVEPFAPLTLSPAASVLHYGQEVFEGLKAYRAADGRALLFRPEANARRFRRSARRLSMPPLPEHLFLAALGELVDVDRDWLPGPPAAGHPSAAEPSLYLRPFMVATEPSLGVRPAAEYLFCVIACPVGAHFAGGTAPITVWIADDYSRAAPGGTGTAKCGGNYAAAMAAHAQAADAGCDQVVFLDATERSRIEELGGMNIFFVLDDGTLLTPPLTDTILPGVTRDAVITLAASAGHRVVQRPYTREELYDAADSGRLREAFACGTAAVVTPIGAVRSARGGCTIGDGNTGPVTARLRTLLTDIQYGRSPDTHHWTRCVP